MRSARFLAIAVLAIVIMPIGLGYCLAFDEVEREGWRTVDDYNLSDRILNSESPYYLPSTSPANNGLLRDGSVFQSPDYVSVSSTPSSIPVFIPSTSDLDQSTISTNLALNASAVNLSEGGTLTVSGGTSSVNWSGFAYQVVASAGFNVMVGASAVASGIDILVVVQESTSSGVWWSIYNGEPSDYLEKIGTYANATLAVDGGTATSININTINPVTITDGYWIVKASVSADPDDWNLMGLRIVTADGSVIMTSHSGGFQAMGANSVVNIFSQNRIIDSVVSVQYILRGSAEISISGPSTGKFADPSEGWRFPADGGTYHSSGTWTNGQQNESVTMYVRQGLLLGLAGATYTVGRDVLYIGVNGCTFNGAPFSFPSTSSVPLQIIFGIDNIKITLINQWPSMYAEPVGYGSVTLDRAAPAEINAIQVSVQDYNDLPSHRHAFRVDSTNIFAGYYPSTRDATLKIDELFGRVPFSLELSSIGVYGDSIRIGTETYAVTDGKITVNGETFALLDLKIGITPGDGTYIVTLNGSQIQTPTGYPSIRFDGDWSLAIRGWTMESFTSISREWIPGEYALDESSAALVGIITCVGVFIALALVRPFSGSKMLMLAIVCGCGAVIFLIML